ncbi:acyltransferase family protein [Undibacterium sp. Dicai25W]|uniref:acyltransferase family protein n=1 Tax=Undibacterium sp. Dicai25W TaxID=3413034 RepID=UPI003BF10702
MLPTFSSTERNSALDNIKGVLIFLVVFGHFIELHIANDSFLRPIWIFVYAFHMPMFALVSGIFSKTIVDEKQALQLIKNIVAPLIAFELIYECTEYVLVGKFSVYAGLVAPYWMLWYLMSLLSWRLMLPLFLRMQFPVALSLILALGTSYSEHAGYLLSSSRTLLFFPYFLVGALIGPELFSSKENDRRLIIISLLIVAIAISSIFFLPPLFDYRWLYGSFSLNRLGMANITGTLYQMLQYTVSCVLGLALLYLLSRKDLGLSRIGKQSMYVFLWHGMTLIILQQSGILPAILRMEPTARLSISLLCSAVIVYLTAHPYCERLTQKIILQPMAALLTGRIKKLAASPAETLPKKSIAAE